MNRSREFSPGNNSALVIRYSHWEESCSFLVLFENLENVSLPSIAIFANYGIIDGISSYITMTDWIP